MSNSKLFKNSGIYAFVQILQKAVGFILLPIYTKLLTPAEKGITDVVLPLVTFYAVFYTLSLNSAIVRYYVDYKEDENKLKQFWGSCITFILVNSLVLTTIIIIFKKVLIMPFAKGIDFYPYILLGLVSITLNPVFVVYQSTLQAREQSAEYGKNNFAYFLVNVSLNILFVVGFKIGAVGILLSLAITDAIFFIYTIFKFLKKLQLGIKLKYLKQGLRYSVPLLPHTLSGWAVTMIDKIFLNGMIDSAATAIYSTASQFGNIINVLTASVNQAYVPWFFNKMKEKEKNEKEIVKIAEVMVVAYSYLAMGLSLFAPEIIMIMTAKSYHESWKCIPFICFAFVFGGLYYFFVNPLFYNKKGVKFIALGTFSGAFLNMLFNYLLIPKYQGVGAAIASLASNFVICILIYVICQKIEKVKFNFVKLNGIVFIFLAIALIPFALINLNIWIAIGIKMIIAIGVTCILLYIYKEYTKLVLQKLRLAYVRIRRK